MPKREWKRENVWLRECLMAPTGGGKTLGALATAANLFDGSLAITLLDTEYERGKLYADAVALASYRVLEDNFSPEAYIAEIDEIEAEFPGGVLIIDSVSHEWNGSRGVLEIVDSKGGGNWKEGTPRHNGFVDRLMRLQMHLIVCCRSKMKWDYSTGSDGKRKQEKLGIGPEQRDNFLYNFDVVGDIDASTHLTTFTNRCRPLVDRTFNLVPDLDDLKAPNEVAGIITTWLSEGDAPEPVQVADPGDVDELVGLLIAEGITLDKVEKGFERYRRENRGELHPDLIATKLEEARARAAAASEGGTEGSTQQAEEAAKA